MKIFTNKSIWKKIAIALVIIILFEFMLSSPVRADDDGVGGKLMEPILSLTTALGDGIVHIIHESVMGQDQSLIRVDMREGIWEHIGGVIIGILAGIAAVAVIVLTAGAAALVAGLVGITATVSIGVSTIIVGAGVGYAVGTWYDNTCLPQDLHLPMYSISAEEIFKGDVLLFDVDFFNPEKDIYVKTKDGNIYKLKEYEGNQEERDELNKIIKDAGGVQNYFYYSDKKDEEGNFKEITTSRQSTAFEIQKIVSKWYNALRNIALVLMMSVLLYVAIRMMLSSMASDKAKYKQMLVDWLVGMCLLFFLHYIMAFSVTIVKQFTKVIDSGFSEDETVYSIVMEDDEAEKLSEFVKDADKGLGMEEFVKEKDGETYIVWPTNLMGKVRLQSQLTMGTSQYIGYAICFIVLVMYTIFFTITYLKRVIYLAFLTIIAPFVALTYPIDKINDGQAQGFNKWLKEYIFNLLIQPMHLLLYTILVSSVFDFAGINIVYMLVSIGFLLPAEKLLRSLFGFEKASTAGSLAGAAIGASMISNGLGKLLHKGPDGANKNRLGKGSAGGDDDGDFPINYNNNSFDEIGVMGGEPLPAGGPGNPPPAGGPGNPPPAGGPGNPPPTGGPGNPPPYSPTGGSYRGRNDYDNDDNIIDLDDSEWSMRDADAPTPLGLPMNNNNYDRDSNISNSNEFEPPIRYADIDTSTSDFPMNYEDYNNDIMNPIRTVEPPYTDIDTSTSDFPTNYDNYNNDISDPIRTVEPPIEYQEDDGIDSNIPPRSTEQENINQHIPIENRNSTPPPSTRNQRDVNRQRQTNKPNNNTSQDSQKDRPTRLQRLKRVAKVGGRRLVSQAGKGIVRGVTNGVLNAPNTAAKLAAGALVGGAAAVVAGAGGIATGDMKNVATYGGAALGAGAMAGTGIVNNARNRFDSTLSNTAQAMKQAYYEDDEYRQKQLEKENRKWKKDLKNREYLEKTVGMDKAKEMYKNGDVDEYLKYGIKDAKEMATIQKLQDEGIARDRQHAMAIHDYAERTGDTTKMKRKDRDEWKDTYKNEFVNRGHSEDNASRLSDDTLKYVDQYNKLKKKL